MDPVALRGVARRQSGARSAGHGRIGARRLRQVSGLALDRLAQCRRLYRRCRRDPNPVFAEARLARLRHPGGGGDEQPRLHQYGPDRALSRRRPARGRLHHGAAGRPGGARDAHRSGRAAQKEPDPADAYPYETRTGWVYDTGNYAAALAKCQALADWAGYAARRARSEAAGKHRGRSITYYVDNTGVFNERMELRFDPSGEVTIVAGTLSHGQGHETSYAQMVADWRGVPEDKIHLKQADTDEVAIGRGTYASRSMMIGVSALRAAADEVIERGKRFAAHFMEADAADIAFADGDFTIAGTDRSMPIGQVAQMSFIPVGLPSELGVGLQGAGAFSSDVPSFPNGCHICEVEIDPETGEAALDRYTVVDDCGTVINPLLAKGQIQGGVAQGAGQALFEDVIYDHDSGQLLTGSLLDYGIPRADTMPAIAIDFSPVPSTTNPLGAKGVGEGGTVASTPTVMNAILDALAPLGVTDVPMPATADRVWRAIREHGKG